MGNGREGWFQTPSIKVGLHGNDPNPQFSIFFNVADLDAAIIRVNELGDKQRHLAPMSRDSAGFASVAILKAFNLASITPLMTLPMNLSLKWFVP